MGNPLYQLAADLLWPLWRGIPDAYKSKYARNIWQQFQDNVQSAAMTSVNLSQFASRLTAKLQITVRNADDAAVLSGIIGGGGDLALLRVLRREALTPILMVRVKNEQRRALVAEAAADRIQAELSDKEIEAVESQKKQSGLFEKEQGRN